MNRYVLAKLAQWAGAPGLAGRKRLQKVVYFLQQAGCPCDAEYELHHYGPYSGDVAATCDAMVAEQLLTECPIHGGYVTYRYTIGEGGDQAIVYTEGRRADLKEQVGPFETLAIELVETDTRVLELGSTILFCWNSLRRTNEGDVWTSAIERAGQFKGVTDRNDPDLIAAIRLARRIAEREAGATPAS